MTALARSTEETAHISTTLVVPAMHCASCMAKVERALAAHRGIAKARVNLTARTVEVCHLPDVTMPELVDALAGIGFTSQPRGDDLAPPPAAIKSLLAPLAVAGFACMNVMLLSVSVWSGAAGATRDLFHWLSAAIGVPAIVFAGRPFFDSAWNALRNHTTNMDVPISIGVTLATGLSLYETATHGAEAWFDGTLMLLLFLLAGRALDAAMRDRARAGVDALLRQAASGAMIIAAGGELEWLPARSLAPGMVMRIAAGERLAADGELVSGTSRFDQSLLTGESTPVIACRGEAVLAGTLNLEAPVDVRVTAAGLGTTLAEIARLMDSAGQTRSKYVRIADRASRLYAPAVHSLAALTFVGWMIAGAGIHQSLVYAIAVLIITCPCALGLAVPVAQVVACSALMKRGIMVKDGSALERMARVDRALLDKTGTMTMGRPLPDAATIAAMPATLAAVALGLASHSRHPLSRALVEALVARGITASPLSAVTEEAGKGLSGQWRGRTAALHRPETASGMATALDIAGEPTWLIAYADRLRPGLDQALGELRVLNVESAILSGDNAAAVAEVARSTGLPAESGLSPQQKQAAIARVQAQGHRVLMVGDGLNDGPALAVADASIAPGTASDVGRQAADMVFLGDSLLALPIAIRASRRTMRVVKQNFVLAIGYNLLSVPLAMAGLVTPLIAAAAMSTSSLVVIANALRLVRAAR